MPRKNSEDNKIYWKKYYEEHKATYLQKRKDKLDPEKEYKRHKKYRENNLEKCKKIASDYYQKNREAILGRTSYHNKMHPEKQRKSNLKCKYGLSLEQFNHMFESQDGICGICKTPFGKLPINRPNTDHCKKTGTIRGLLCMLCNTGIGSFYHNSDLLEKAKEYLWKYQ